MSFKEGNDVVGFVGVTAVRGRIKRQGLNLLVLGLLTGTDSLVLEVGKPGVACDHQEAQL